MDLFVAIVTGTLAAATPFLFAALGELIAEKSGVLNLGIEGMMLIGAVFAFSAALAGWPMAAAIFIGALAGTVLSLIFAVLALTFQANQYAIGIALAIFGTGTANFWGRNLGGVPITALPEIHIPFLSDLPVVGQILFSYDPLIYLGLLMCVAVSWFLYKTHAGRVLRVVGESPENAHAIGYNVIRIRYASVLFGGMMAGLAGAYLSVAYTPLWIANMTAGRGWIALALVVFATWRPFRVLLGSWLFGLLTVLELQAQVHGVNVPSQVLASVPYVATIVVLAIISRKRRLLVENFPASLARPFRPGE